MNKSELRVKFAAKVQVVPMKSYDCSFTIRPMSALEKAQLIDKHKAALKIADGEEISVEKVMKEVQCYAVSKTLIDDNGNRLYADAEVDQIATDFPCDALDFLAKKIMIISGIEQEEDETIKNSDPTPNDASS
jgi:hypothetical protein